jgi:hypothetical protein
MGIEHTRQKNFLDDFKINRNKFENDNLNSNSLDLQKDGLKPEQKNPKASYSLDLGFNTQLVNFNLGPSESPSADSPEDVDSQWKTLGSKAEDFSTAKESDPEIKVDESRNKIIDFAKAFEAALTTKDKADLLKTTNELFSQLSPETQVELIKKFAQTTLQNNYIGGDRQAEFASLIANEVANLNPEDRNDVIDLVVALHDSPNHELVSNIFDNGHDLSKDLNLDYDTIHNAQKTVANNLVDLIVNEGNRMGKPLNVEALTFLLAPPQKYDSVLGRNTGSNYGLFNGDQSINGQSIDNLSKSLAHNIVNNPVTPEEKSLNYTANTQRAAELERKVREGTPEAIRQRANQEEADFRARLPNGGSLINGIIKNKKKDGIAAAQRDANTWTPGSRANKVHQGMTDKYNENIPLSQKMMLEEVERQAKSQLNEQLTSLSQSERDALQLFGKALGHNLDRQLRADTIRLDDVNHLKLLGEVASSLRDTLTPLPLEQRVDHKRIEFLRESSSNHGNFEVFKDKTTGDSFYRLTAPDGQIRYAYMNTNDNKNRFIDKDPRYKAVIESYEQFSKRRENPFYGLYQHIGFATLISNELSK